VKSLNVPAGQDDFEVAALLHKKGEALLYKNEFVKAKATFDSAMQIHKKILGYLNDFSHTKLLFQECVRIPENQSGRMMYVLSSHLFGLGDNIKRSKSPRKLSSDTYHLFKYVRRRRRQSITDLL